MEISELTVDLSRIQFAFTAIFHFIFVPLTLGLSWMLLVMEFAYVRTGKQIYKDMTQFWGKLFAINFAMGVVTGITMEFEFGLNWGYFSRAIGESFGSALAIEGITAFMIEAVLFGFFFFTWEKVNRKTHLAITGFMALGTNLSIVNILVANSFMQNPEGAFFNPETMSMQLKSFIELYGQSLAQIRIGHVAFGAFVVAATFVTGISSWYLLKNRDVGFAYRSLGVSLGFGVVSTIFAFFMGDANGLAIAKDEPAKMAAVEAQWETQKPPASWVAFAIPDQNAQTNIAPIKIPWLLSIIAHHNLSGTVKGLKPIIKQNRERVKKGLVAYRALHAIRAGKATKKDRAIFNPDNPDTKQYRSNIGYAFLLNQYAQKPLNPTSQEIKQAAKNSIPEVIISFFSFRAMLAFWAITTLILMLGLVFLIKGDLHKRRWLLKGALYSIPLPYLAAEAGWILAESGRQPWIVRDYMPTSMGVSTLDPGSVIASLSFFGLFYMLLLGVELFLMFKVARKGPSSLGTGRYHFE